MIKISDRYAIDADAKQYIVKEIRVAKEGKNAGEACDTPVAYLSSMDACMRWIVRDIHREKVAKATRDMSIDEAAELFAKIERQIEQWAKTITKGA